MDPSPHQAPVERFRSVVVDGVPRLDLPAALIAAHCSSREVDVAGVLSELDELAGQVGEPTIDGVVRLLFHELAFKGNSDAYYDADNSYLDQVIARRTGIPISLSVLAIEVARRVDVSLFGVGMPGHFLVGDRSDPDRFLDAFSGAVLDTGQARGLFERLQPQARFDPTFLGETPPQAILLRMLNNLRMIHHQARNTAALAASLELLICLDDCPLEEYRSLAGALEMQGRVDEAARHLEDAAARYGGTDADQLLAQATRFWAKLN